MQITPKYKLTAKLRRLINKLARNNYKSPLMRQDGFQAINGKDFKEYFHGSGRKLPEGFNEENEYTVPCYESFNLEVGGLYNELLGLFKTGGMESINKRIEHIQSMQKLHKDVIKSA